jgi:5-(carboxyamino)imidazole ribonucleotide mutase
MDRLLKDISFYKATEMSKVSLIVGSESDRALGEKAESVLKEFFVEYEFEVFSAHRNPKALQEYINSSDASVFIAIAGLSAALPGFIAAHTLKPVIGVPKEVKLGGLDSLLSIVQMPTGVPVACVGIDNAKNAAFLALEILSLNNGDLLNKLKMYKQNRASRISSQHV